MKVYKEDDKGNLIYDTGEKGCITESFPPNFRWKVEDMVSKNEAVIIPYENSN